MVKKITYLLVTIIFFGGLFWLLSQPPKSTTESVVQSDSADTAADVTSVETEVSTEEDKYENYPIYDNPDLVFYWGNGCPHCENVEEWLDQNNTNQTLKINYKEVYYNQESQQELINTVEEYCPELAESGGIGVPTGFDPESKTCIQGDTPIIEFLSAKLGN